MVAQTEQQLFAAIDARRAAGIGDLRAELMQRIGDLGDLRLDTPARQAAFQEVFAAFTPAQFDFYAMADECGPGRLRPARRAGSGRAGPALMPEGSAGAAGVQGRG